MAEKLYRQSSSEGRVEIPEDEADIIRAEWTKVREEKIATKWLRERENEYPSIEDLVVALYDTDDKAALETKRAAVKTKWPKDNSGPV